MILLFVTILFEMEECLGVLCDTKVLHKLKGKCCTGQSVGR